MKTKTRKVRVIYMGRRLNSKEQVRHVFLVGKRELHFKKARHCRIGETYFAEQERDKAYSIFLTPPLAEEKDQLPISAEQIQLWEAEDLGVEALRDRKLAKAKARRLRFKEIIALIKPIIKNMGYLERRYFVEALVLQAERNLK